RFWAPVHTIETSQQIADWYTLSHIIHGFILFFLIWFVLRKWPIRTRAVLALALEAVWEIIENTPMVIAHYRQATISKHYYGDSVLNSVFDILFMLVGFYLASRLPAWVTVALAVVMEALAAYVIRD